MTLSVASGQVPCFNLPSTRDDMKPKVKNNRVFVNIKPTGHMLDNNYQACALRAGNIR